jgi:hypothetical protein
MVKHDQGWRITSPRILSTDSKTLERILGIIKSGKIEKVITDDMKRTDEFGLKNPRAVLSIGYQGKIDELYLGDSNPAQTGIYAFAQGVKSIFLVHNELEGLQSVNLYDLRSKILFRFDSETVTGIEIKKKTGIVKLKKTNNTWQMLSPVSGRAGQDDVRDFLLEILQQRADEFFDDSIPDTAIFRDTVKLSLFQNGNVSHEIDIYYWGTRADQGVVAYQKGMKYAGRLSRDFWNFVNSDVSLFRYRNLFDFNEADIQSIHIKKDTSDYELMKRGANWMREDKPVQKKKIMEFIWFLKAWKAERLLEPSLTVQKDIHTVTITLRDNQNNDIGSVSVYGKIEGQILGYSPEVEGYSLYYAISDNLQDTCAVSSLDIERILEKGDLER